MAQAGGRTWYHPCNASFAGMQNTRVVGSWRHAITFQRTAWNARPCVIGFKSLKAVPEIAMCEAMRVQWRPQDIRDARNVEHLLRKASGTSPGKSPYQPQVERP
jgi:hypothetical protein